MSQSGYVILEGIPTAQVYHDLRKLAGLTPPPMDARHMIDDTTPGADQTAVAMGRLVGDKSLFLICVDIAVHPDHQRKGLGKRIMQSLVDHVDKHAPDAYVSLVAEPAGQKLYPQYGFKDVEPSIGMYRMIRSRKVEELPVKEGADALE
ncbi:glucosamine 6-phosphate N-acetyltransferase [Parastagonospora nodorum]|nr:glucosamine 6-phosphate N-acetyltransferase [Parastagonospora nodorum]KAH4249545.1 glucosamine 6-phosphate N-acetyltransferase [Parastagonospora nodorum]